MADARQVFTVETGGDAGTPLLATSHLPLLRTGRIRPLYRRPGGTEPNLAPGLLDHLAARLGVRPAAPDVLAWILATVRPDLTIPLTEDPGLWESGVDVGRRTLWPDAPRRRAPQGAPVAAARTSARPCRSWPLGLRYDRDEETLHLDGGPHLPVPPEGLGLLRWPGPGSWRPGSRPAPHRPSRVTLAAIRPATWPQSWTSELLELITVLALLVELRPLRAELEPASPVTAADLREAGVLPVPAPSRRPASVLDHREEGPDGQFTLL